MITLCPNRYSFNIPLSHISTAKKYICPPPPTDTTMKPILFVTALLLSLAPLVAQQPDKGAPQSRGIIPVSPSDAAPTTVTRAVVVGISDYQNPAITDLQYADRDAAAFAQYLQSPAGGSLDSNHLIVLLNEKATAGAVSVALDWLLTETREGEQAILYFSGHGDVERKTITQPGFLLCWDAPARVYYGGGTVQVGMLKEIVATLSQQTKAKVMLITDACRAGKLAGSDIGGPQATAANMANQFANEIKILSCQPEEYSLEGPNWGGGRGVFSYFLLQGLIGLADGNADKKVNLLEIERYLTDKVPAAVAPHSQIPLAVGSKGNTVALVDAGALAALLQNDPAGDPAGGGTLASRQRGMPGDLETVKDSSILALYQQFKNAIQDGRLLYPPANSAWALYEQLKEKPAAAPFQGLLRRDLAAALQDDAQQAINDYLAANPSELRRRWGYSDRYDLFPEYLGKAAELLPDNKALFTSLKAREHYFRGLNYRLRGERERKPDLYPLALGEQEECLKLDPEAAYAYNELGLLQRRLRKFEASIGYFEQATARAPRWVLPWANICGSYFDLRKFPEAEAAGVKALQLDSTFSAALYNLGSIYQYKTDYEKAKSFYRKAIRYEPGYADAYFNLGSIAYLREKDYPEAEKMWAAAVNLRPDVPYMVNNLGEARLSLGKKDAALACFQKALALDPNYEEAHSSLADFYLGEGKYAEAETALGRWIELQPQNPSAYYRMACVKALQQQPNPALDALEKALANGYDDIKTVQEDPRLSSIRTEARFARLIEKYRK